MECKNCELRQRQFLCENCLRAHLRDYRLQTHHFATEKDEQVSKSVKALETMEAGRMRRADVSSIQSRVDELMSGLTKLRKDNDKKRARLQTLRETLATRRRTLSAAKLLPSSSASSQVTREAQELNALSSAIARARSGLVQELVEVFNVVEVGGRPPVGGKAGTKGEWTIGGLILPVPGDIRRYPPDHINAVITHTIHFLSLLTFYLGIKLPFEITWSGKKLGVGQPCIGAIKGGESGGWAKWHTKQPLHLTSNPTTAPSSPSSSSGNSPGDTSNPALLSDSVVETDPQPQQSFTTAFAMLLYNVCYLAFTQNVDVPLNQAGDVLSNLWSVCCSSDLGKRSHETHPLLPAPTPSTFLLDYAQLLQATSATPTTRLRPHSSQKKVSSRRSSVSLGKDMTRDIKREKIIEAVDEDGWDLVEDEGF